MLCGYDVPPCLTPPECIGKVLFRVRLRYERRTPRHFGHHRLHQRCNFHQDGESSHCHETWLEKEALRPSCIVRNDYGLVVTCLCGLNCREGWDCKKRLCARSRQQEKVYTMQALDVNLRWSKGRCVRLRRHIHALQLGGTMLFQQAKIGMPVFGHSLMESFFAQFQMRGAFLETSMLPFATSD